MKQLIYLVILTVLVAMLSSCAALAATPEDSGQIEINLKDYDIQPRVIRVEAGQQVTFVLKNEGDKLHELMIGRDVNIEGDFSEGFAEDFFAGITPEIEGPGMVMGLEGGDMAGMEGMAGMDMGSDEMAGMDESASEQMGDENMTGMDMGEGEMAGMTEDETSSGMSEMDTMGEDMAGMDESASETMADEDMAGMDMGSDEMAEDEAASAMSEMDTMGEDMAGMDESADETMADEDMAGMDEHVMAEDEHTEEDDHAEDEMAGMGHDEMEGMGHDMIGTSFGVLQRPSMDAHAGLMVMLDPAPMPEETVTTITFTVPEDKVGTWTMGCFQEQGQHYDDGMRGTLIVEPAS